MRSTGAVIVLFFCLLRATALFAQNDKDADKVLFNKAADIRKEGNKYFTKDPAKADKLFTEANRIYHGTADASLGLQEHQNRLPTLRYYHGDIRGGNKAVEDEINSLRKKTQVLIPKMIGNGYIPSTEVIKVYYTQRAYLNLSYGDAALASSDIRKIIELGFEKDEYNTQHTSWAGGLGSARLQNLFQLGQYIAFLNEDKQLIADMQPVFVKMQEEDFVTTGQIYLAILNKEYDKAISIASNFAETGANNRINARFLIAWSYALQKQTVKSEEYIKLLLKGIRVGPKMVARINALNAINEKKYQEAVGYADESLKPMRYLYLSYEQPGKFFYYSVRAQAYAGLKQYEKAKADYERALLYNAEYAPAINGLAQLEAAIIREQRGDKTAPLITVLEPGAKRGLKVTAAAKEVMVKGLAEDPSGIKEVTINNQVVYLKPDGNFWGNVSLKEGVNTITISATDIAGNRAEQNIEVETQVANAKTDDIVPVVSKESKNYALVIAAQNYDDTQIPSLENPVSDAIKLKLVLKNQYNFSEDNIYTLYNPVVADLRKKFADINEFIQPEDNLVIFYAGHGIWVEKEKKGYWLLTDAKRNDVNTWFSNKLMLDLIAQVAARHTLLITDACFSGSIFKTRSLGADAPPAVRELSEKISRVAITSGNDTEVPDESVFMKYLIKALSENKEKYLTAQKMFINQIIEAVMSETKIEPRYGTLELAGHIGGDYIFTKK